MTLPEDPNLVSFEHIAEIVAAKLSPAIQRIVRLMEDGQLSYSVSSLVAVTDVSRTEVYEAMKRGELTPSYPNARPIILRGEAIRWLATLPNERPLS